ncbi:hypothetical protein UCRPA7_4999 [Phaeoacremonium minimum UCRPA7]|uniref:Uncharacterized protein n=1 Tax=Phaeoacremonium minimum (strain UCR-PA7) TaxID=1286976 RepID=R8BJJ8_PHAM7|nr:hypothetical protein UCRPA7_4999 [Phaeoacremonium minimum UCRPA7]EON99454.1 hypothetical protein UCRPA7_4999 [Phaeoacremonium minimum UCRPA7]
MQDGTGDHQEALPSSQENFPGPFISQVPAVAGREAATPHAEVEYLTFPSGQGQEEEEIYDLTAVDPWPAFDQPADLDDLEQLAAANLQPFLEQNFPVYPPEMSADFDPVAGTINPALLRVATQNSGIDPAIEQNIKQMQENGTLFQTMNQAATLAHQTKKAMEAANLSGSQGLANSDQMMAGQNLAHAIKKPSKVPELPEHHTAEQLHAYNQALFDETYDEIMDEIKNDHVARAQREGHSTNPVTGLPFQKEDDLCSAAFKPGAHDVFMGAPAMAVNADLSDQAPFTNGSVHNNRPAGQRIRLKLNPKPRQAKNHSTAAPTSVAPRRGAVPSNSAPFSGRHPGGNPARHAEPIVDNVFARRDEELDPAIEEAGEFFEAEFNRVMAARGYDSDRDLMAAEAPWAAHELGWLAGNLNDAAQTAMENTLHHPEMKLRGMASNGNSGATLDDWSLAEEDRIPAKSAIMDHREHPNPTHVAAINRGRQTTDPAYFQDADYAMDVDSPTPGRTQPHLPDTSAHESSLITPTRGRGGPPKTPRGTSSGNGSGAQQTYFAPAQLGIPGPASSQPTDTVPDNSGQATNATEPATGGLGTTGVAGLSPPPSRPGTSAGAQK